LNPFFGLSLLRF